MEHPAETLTRDAVRLRRWHDDEVDLVHRVVTGSLPHLRPWLRWAELPYNRDAAAVFLAKSRERWRSGMAYAYAITEDDVVAGACALMRPLTADSLQLGYWLHPAHTGRGLATVAASLLVDEAFLLPGIRRVEIWHDAANIASEAVPRRLGFVEVGRHSTRGEPLTSGKIGIDVVWERKAS
ncbi:MAG: ribosomal-protein-serine acetyltransferase [Actinomycetota bacterium]|jgi:RimJ/RimL family protein N-acetyltransferase|nr:ribosomal-protein-serine acetyltransferase [Actinomycetota bacterium]